MKKYILLNLFCLVVFGFILTFVQDVHAQRQIDSRRANTTRSDVILEARQPSANGNVMVQDARVTDSGGPPVATPPANLTRQQRLELVRQNRSDVANAVEDLLQTPERRGGIGEEVREVAREHIRVQDELERDVARVGSRSGFLRFLLGSDQSAVRQARSGIDQVNSRLERLRAMQEEVTIESDRERVQTAIESLEVQQNTLRDTIDTEANRFSILGSIFNLFFAN